MVHIYSSRDMSLACKSLFTNAIFFYTVPTCVFVEIKPHLYIHGGEKLMRVATDPEHCVLNHAFFIYASNDPAILRWEDTLTDSHTFVPS